MPDTYVKLNDSFPEHWKVVDVGGDAGWLYVCALAYASRNLTDGRIPIGLVSRLSDRKQPAKLAARLVEVRLWHTAGHDCPRCEQPGPNEYVIHDYLIHQRSAAKVDEIKAKRAVAGRSGGVRKAANTKAPAKPKAKQTPSNLLDGWQEAVEAKATPDTEVVLRTTRAEEPLRGSQAEADVPPTAGADAPLPEVEVTSQTIVGEWIDRCKKRPPGNVIGQISKQIKTMLDEGVAPDDIRRGLADWMFKDVHPSVLPSLVNSAMNASGGRSGSSNGSGSHLPERTVYDASKVFKNRKSA